MKLRTYLKLLISPILGKKKLQKVYEILLEFSLYGMNIGAEININKNGELQVLKQIEKYFSEKTEIILFDVGANVGNYLLSAKKILKNKLIAHAFEPNKQTFQQLEQNLKNSKNVSLYNFGLSDKPRKELIYYDSKRMSLASLYKRRLDHFNINLDNEEEIELNTIDSFCESQGILTIDFLKIDAEGHDLQVLKGASKLLNSGQIKFIQFEFGGSNIDSKTFFQDFYYLLKGNFRIFRIIKDGLYEIKFYKELYEIFKYSNFLAIKKE